MLVYFNTYILDSYYKFQTGKHCVTLNFMFIFGFTMRQSSFEALPNDLWPWSHTWNKYSTASMTFFD